eukprot:749019-Hanusia_phi.AAC.2
MVMGTMELNRSLKQAIGGRRGLGALLWRAMKGRVLNFYLGGVRVRENGRGGGKNPEEGRGSESGEAWRERKFVAMQGRYLPCAMPRFVRVSWNIFAVFTTLELSCRFRDRCVKIKNYSDCSSNVFDGDE